ncbi:ribonuclease H-like protein [Dothidotthia symphoricarpi CBS 119687]|uniref:ribonuclease H n=1 Tax=Dothidotthia symphoricarpi CBS 119687 TaxID=1392245 RepID=A0A6A6AA92_9PLEO|nr:ribonuclease H-like protein [Dothidotthia symphoricarpi CBS 119687]KAF2128740.1 ribonuclease H-like protein [Dothidotthia symphoricarpi CBS 119687]
MSTPSDTSSAKRKRGSTKFYAVKAGRIPGIYHSWEDCKRQVEGTRSVYKSFSTLAEANAFINGNPSATSSSKAQNGKPGKFYAVASGVVPGIYTDWPTAQAQVETRGAKYKSFATRQEAQTWFDANKRDWSVPISMRGDLSETSSLATGKGRETVELSPKKQKKNNGSAAPTLTNGHINFDPGYGPLPADAEDGFDTTLKLDLDSGAIRLKTEAESIATKTQPTGDFTGPIKVFTDGSSIGNGKAGAVAGVGVYFGPNDSRNVSEALRGTKQTNQRAELVAVARALDHVPIDRDVLIHTDSRYSISCLTEWFVKWETNGWKSANGKDVDNKDLVEPILARIREREMSKAKTQFQWVKGHANHPGNVAADRLAVTGSRNSTSYLRSAEEFSVTLRTPTGSRKSTDKERKVVEDEAANDELFDLYETDQSMNPFELPSQAATKNDRKETTQTNGATGGQQKGNDETDLDFVDSPAGFLFQTLHR